MTPIEQTCWETYLLRQEEPFIGGLCWRTSSEINSWAEAAKVLKQLILTSLACCF